jgi:hypothetical protein
MLGFIYQWNSALVYGDWDCVLDIDSAESKQAISGRFETGRNIEGGSIISCAWFRIDTGKCL